MGVRQIAMHNYNKEVFTAKLLEKAFTQSNNLIFHCLRTLSEGSPLFDTVFRQTTRLVNFATIDTHSEDFLQNQL